MDFGLFVHIPKPQLFH